MVYLYRAIDKVALACSVKLFVPLDPSWIRSIVTEMRLISPDFCDPIKPTITYTKVKYCNNTLKKDHWNIKRIMNLMRGFKNFDYAVRTIKKLQPLRKN